MSRTIKDLYRIRHIDPHTGKKRDTKVKMSQHQALEYVDGLSRHGIGEFWVVPVKEEKK